MAIDLADIAAGSGGFVLVGESFADHSGFSISSAGDINGDGFDDLLIGTPGGDGPQNSRDRAGDTYVVFGHAGGFTAQIDLATIAAGNGGFVVYGATGFGSGLTGEEAGFSVSSGDFNGDGFDDLLIGAPFGAGSGDTGVGDTYVVYGHSGSFAAQIDLANVASGNGGFVIHGRIAREQSGYSVSSVGDINGDGLDDIVIGTSSQQTSPTPSGDSYVVFGRTGTPGTAIDLAAVAAGQGGFVIHGVNFGDVAGQSVSSAGDINGDGYDDLLIGAQGVDRPNGRTDVGGAYVVFGHAGGFPAEIDLAAVAAGNGGFVIQGEDAGDVLGWSVASAGDINADGFDDLVIGAFGGDGPSNTRANAGDTFVLFGHRGGFPAQISLPVLLAGTSGFVIHGQTAGQDSGFSVASAGDINGDGFADIIIGAPHTGLGQAYVVFGQAAGFPSEIDLAAVAAGNGGFVINGRFTGTAANEHAGISVSSAGDINGDGFADLMVGAPDADRPAAPPFDPFNGHVVGDTYIIFGSATVGGSVNHVTQQGLSASETFTGTLGADDIVAGGGNDTLLGNGGQDVLIGGEGNDLLSIGDTAFVRVSGGNGFDTLAFLHGIRFDDNDMRRVDGIENIQLGDGDTTLIMGAVAEHSIDGVAANNFQITVDGSLEVNAAVTVNGEELHRGLTANLSNDHTAVTLLGGAGADVLTGGFANDTISGGLGADLLNGGGGDDALTGGGRIMLNAFADAGSWTPASDGSQGWYVGDFNADGRDDILRYNDGVSGAEVFLSNGSVFAPTGSWTPAGNDGRWYVGDFDGDGRSDIFRYHEGFSGAEVFNSTGSSFAGGSSWTPASDGSQGWYVGDFNGDGRDDIFRYSDGVSGAEMFLSNGTGFAPAGGWTPAGNDGRWYVGDFNGDGRSDIFRYHEGVSGAEVFLSNGSGFDFAGSWTGASNGSQGWYVGDFNGDGRDDILRYNPGVSGAEVFLSNGSGFDFAGSWTGATNDPRGWRVGDFNGGGGDDIFRYQDGVSGANALTSDNGAGDGDRFIWNGGNDVIADFQASVANHDVVEIDHALLANFNDLMAHAQQVGIDTVVTVDPATSLTLRNVAMHTLSNSDFFFA